MSSISTTETTTKLEIAKSKWHFCPPHCSHPCSPHGHCHCLHSQLNSSAAARSPPTNRVRVPVQARMAAVMPATPATPTTTTTMPMPSYQVSGAGAGAAAPRHGASAGSSIGAFFGVLAAVLVLTVLSCVFGRVCAAQAEGPDESYDCTRLACWRRRRRAPRRRPAPAAEVKPQPAAEGPPPLPLPEP